MGADNLASFEAGEDLSLPLLTNLNLVMRDEDDGAGRHNRLHDGPGGQAVPCLDAFERIARRRSTIHTLLATLNVPLANPPPRGRVTRRLIPLHNPRDA